MSFQKILAFVKKHSITILRVLSQLTFFFLAPGLFTSAFGGAKSIAASMGGGEVLELSAHITTLILLTAFTLLFGRIFCGYACSFGALGDAVYTMAGWLKKKMGLKAKPLNPPQWLKYLKYVVLAVILVICFTGNQQSLHDISPWNVFAQFVGGSIPSAAYWVGYIVLALIIIGMAMVPRFFCRFLCPMGAIFSILPPALLLRIKKPSAAGDSFKACGKCKLCSSKCPAGLTLNQEDAITSGECFSCHRCVEACYQHKPRLSFFGWAGLTRLKILLIIALLMALVLLLGL